MPAYLVIQLARFGDLVQTKRLLLSLLGETEAEVHLCLDESLVALARLLYPTVHLHPVCAHGTVLAKLPPAEQARVLLERNVTAFRELAGIRFSRVYNLNFSPLNYRLAALFDPQSVRGHVWQNGQEIVGQWSRLAMRWSAMRRIGLNIADFWAWHHASPVPATEVNPVAKGKGGGLGVVMAGRESRRSLPPKVLAALVTALLDIRGDDALVLLGSKAELQAARQLERELPGRHARVLKNLCGATGWGSLVDVVGGLDLVLTPDTGTMHLAAHLGIPVLATFLSSAWCFETGPYGLGHQVLQANIECAPCLESQPCTAQVACLQPFMDTDIVRYLSTLDANHLPSGVTVFNSDTDKLGQTFTAKAGPDPQSELRGRFRDFLSEHLSAGQGEPSQMLNELAERLYMERDWMVPDAESSSGRFSGISSSIIT
ncbi:MAG: glycosyltransferase family 9 protein [Humidesulfovibrio sp.]|uniref:glycosyltransferase family 9 protein n=1 Tax=Humidesulfovibrio sp. TaxID=2910988 RepID=UPI0027EB9EA5|nr:glycosyltransferase family 9 protein [Humidesulfovibrio sp.]MDQ7834456.1 glycosyltransferase family 9 protein [Humidesulfovibrio sp.]